MEILGLDENFQSVGYIKWSNLQWKRRYYTSGDFSVQIEAKNYNPAIKYIYTEERKEFGIVNKPEYKENMQGKFVQLYGYFYESTLSDKIIFPRYIKSGNIEVVARDMVTKFKEDIPRLTLGNLSNLGTNVSLQETGSELSDRLYDLLKTQEMSYRTRLVMTNNDISVLFEVWQGKDRTDEQSVNPYCTFSTGFGNMKNVECTTDDSNFKNYAVVVGNGSFEEGNQIIYNIDKSNGGYKKKIYVDATHLLYNTQEQTLAQYNESLRQYGEEELLRYQKIQKVDFDADISSLKYMVDFDLGDLCDIVVDSLHISMKSRIIEIYEVFKNNVHTITLTFGEQIPTVYEKARLK